MAETRVSCAMCGKQFTIPVHRHVKKPSQEHCCSRKCIRSYWTKYIKTVIAQSKMKPNHQESKLFTLLEGYGFLYVGNGKFSIDRRNPDFVHKKQKKVVELFGEYWHPKADVGNRKRLYAKYGYRCLVVWVAELKNLDAVDTRISRFMKKRR